MRIPAFSLTSSVLCTLLAACASTPAPKAPAITAPTVQVPPVKVGLALGGGAATGGNATGAGSWATLGAGTTTALLRSLSVSAGFESVAMWAGTGGRSTGFAGTGVGTTLGAAAGLGRFAGGSGAGGGGSGLAAAGGGGTTDWRVAMSGCASFGAWGACSPLQRTSACNTIDANSAATKRCRAATAKKSAPAGPPAEVLGKNTMLCYAVTTL